MKTLAWVLHDQNNDNNEAILKKETISIESLTENEVLIEPLYGGWEANMTHALERNPVNVCRKRRESKVVLGNAGIVRVLRTGYKVSNLKEGDICVFFGISSDNFLNRLGYLDTYFAFGYDQPGTIGLLAKQTKVNKENLILIPQNSKLLLHQWPILSIRFATAWSNWKATFPCWRAQVTKEEYPAPYVFGWGGGTTLGGLLLAKEEGFKVAMVASNNDRLEFIKKLGIIPVDRRRFPNLNYDEKKYESNREYRKKYLESLRIFRNIVNDITEAEGVSIFIDNIGVPVYSATIRVLARPGVITTSGWKQGMDIKVNRALECHFRHIHVFTHGYRLFEANECMKFATENSWIPQDNSPIYDWEDIPQLAHDFSLGKIDSYFPTYQVNLV